MRGFVFLGLVLMALAAPVARGSQPTPSSSVDTLYQAAGRLQYAAEHSTVVAISLDYYRQAVLQYREVVRLKPDLQQAQVSLATCLQKLAKLTPSRTEEEKLVQAARQQFAVAAKGAGDDWRPYLAWGGFLMWDATNRRVDDSQRREVLQEAESVLEQGLSKVTYTGERSEFQISLGICQVVLSRQGAVGEERLALLRRADNNFDAVAKMEKSPRPMMYGWWGVAQLELARLTGSYWQTWQAIGLFEKTIEKDPDDLQTRYNLVCAYALINENEKAIRELRLLFDRDVKRSYYKAAADDVDLNSLRRSAEFNALFVPDSTTSAVLGPALAPKVDRNQLFRAGGSAQAPMLAPALAPITDR